MLNLPDSSLKIYRHVLKLGGAKCKNMWLACAIGCSCKMGVGLVYRIGYIYYIP